MIECLRCWCSTTRKHFDSYDGLCARCSPRDKKTPGTIVVYRVEHVEGCQKRAAGSQRTQPRHPHHGPWRAKCPDPAPLFGGGGPSPEEEGHNISPYWLCGVTLAQFDLWWTTGYSAEEILASIVAADITGWRVTEYEVPRADVAELPSQVVFSPGRAEVIRRHLLKDLCCLS